MLLKFLKRNLNLIIICQKIAPHFIMNTNYSPEGAANNSTPQNSAPAQYVVFFFLSFFFVCLFLPLQKNSFKRTIMVKRKFIPLHFYPMCIN